MVAKVPILVQSMTAALMGLRIARTSTMSQGITIIQIQNMREPARPAIVPDIRHFISDPSMLYVQTYWYDTSVVMKR